MVYVPLALTQARALRGCCDEVPKPLKWKMRAKVGDRYVMAELAANGWQLGGENSGHLVCCQHTTTGDAIIAALRDADPVSSVERA